jgi:hypothetical protein
MKKKEFEVLGKHIIASMPGYECKGALVYATRLNHVLRGFHFQGSDFDSWTFYVSVFALPLFIPTTYLYLTLGKRLRHHSGGDMWDKTKPHFQEELDECIHNEGMAFLGGLEGPKGVITLIETRFAQSTNPHISEALAYARVMEGDVAEAKAVLDRFLPKLDPNVSWQEEIKTRAMQVRELIAERPAACRQLLEKWEAETTNNLGLTQN